MGTCLVTGGAGFIGLHLVEALVSRGSQVRILDDLSSGNRQDIPDGCELIVGDIRDTQVVSKALVGVDTCFHLAAISSVQASIDAYEVTHGINLGATVLLMEQAAHAKIPLVYASSAAVYGDCADLPLHELVNCHPLTPYGLDKWGCEQHARVAAQYLGLRSVGLRFFNVYGERQDPSSPYSGVISVFANRVANDRVLTLYGDGKQTRDFVYVKDVVHGLLAAENYLHDAVGASVFNICSGEAITILELATIIEHVAGTSVGREYAAPRPGDIRHSCGDPARAALDLGWSAQTPIDVGLQATLAYMLGATAIV